MQSNLRQPCVPFLPTLLPNSAISTPQDARQSSVRTDLAQALSLLRSSSAAKKFMLSPPTPSADLALLTSPRPLFTISTEEVQEGTLPGQIALRYLGIPAFPDTEGLSGGLCVTTYANRTHPLHDPAVMADVRVGRYVRDNSTGEWCIITRNNTDRLVRLQYMRVTPEGARERIGLTCSIDLFDRGRFLESVLFKCHDFEWRVCHRCASPLCLCRGSSVPSSVPMGLDTVAQTVLREGADEWVGTVRVTVVSNISKNPLLNIDDTMTVSSSYKPAIDNDLAAHMQRLAIMETASEAMNVPAPLSTIQPQDNEAPKEVLPAESESSTSSSSDMRYDTTFNVISNPSPGPPALPPTKSLPLTPPKSPDGSQVLGNTVLDIENPPSKETPFSELTFDDVFGQEGVEIADHFLIPSEVPLRNYIEDEIDFPMLPADPSTLPGGVEACMEGMDFDDRVYLDDGEDDDCFSLMTSDRDTRSVSSALSTAGSDSAPLVDSVPPPGDDVVDAISALNLSSTHQTGVISSSAKVPPKSPAKLQNEKSLKTQEEDYDNTIKCRPSVQSMSPINAPINDPSRTRMEFDCTNESIIKEEAYHELESLTSIVALPIVASKTENIEVEASDPKSVGDGANKVERAPSAPTQTPSSLQIAVTTMIPPLPTVTPSVPPMVPTFMPSAVPTVNYTNGSGMWMVRDNGTGCINMNQVGLTASGTNNIGSLDGGVCAENAGRLYGQAPRLAPRPEGVSVNNGFMFQMNTFGNQYTVAARLEALEKERKAEERRKKNRQAAARSNARKKDLMDGIRTEIHKSRQRAHQLRVRQEVLQQENNELKRQLEAK